MWGRGHCCMNWPEAPEGFYRQYIQQHGQMVQWVRQLHSTEAINEWYNSTHHRYYHNCISRAPYASPALNECNELETYYDQKYEHNAGYQEEPYDETCAEFTLSIDPVVNPEAIEAESEESFEMVNSPKEEFEYLELNPYGKLEKKQTNVRMEPAVLENTEQEQKEMEFLYGSHADKLSGLETNMAVKFENLCDTHNPHLWPVLPLRL